MNTKKNNTVCKYCGNKATVKDFREINGQVNKELVCNTCANLTNEGVLDRQSEFDEFVSRKDSIFNSAMDEFWDTINSQIYIETDEQGWAEWMVKEMGKELKKQS